MKRFLLAVLLVALWFSTAQAQTAFDIEAMKRFEGKALPKALKYLQKNLGASFSFSSGSIDDVIVPLLPDSLQDIGVFLDVVLIESPLTSARVGDTYVIYARDDEDIGTPIRMEFALSGVVRDKSSLEALPFASVSVLGTNNATITNTDGKFTLLKVPSDTATIALRYLGYKALNIKLSPRMSQGALYLEMEPHQRELPSVEISASREQMLELGKQVGQLAFNPAEISRLPNLGEFDLFGALRLLPGVSGNTEASAGLRIRGSASDENLVLFDGITVYHVDHFFGFLTAFNSNVVKNVQVSKGGFGAKYGGRTSGVIDITGIDGNKKKPSVTLEAGALSANVLLELPLVEDKASLIFAYRRAFTDVIRSPTYRRMFNNLFNGSLPNSEPSDIDVFQSDEVPDFAYSDLNAKFHFKPSNKDAIALSFYQGRDDLSIAFSAEANGLTRISSDATSWGNTGGSIKWSRKWNRRLFTYANFGLSRYRSNLDAEISFLLNDDEVLSRRFFEQQTGLIDNTLRIDNTYELSPASRLVFGLWHSNYRIEMQSQDQDFIFSDSLQEARLTATYVDYERRMGRFTAKGGLRASYYDADASMYLEPRISLTYTLTEYLGFKAAAGRYHQMIRRLNERSLYFSIPETWTLASQDNVPVLLSDQYIVGLQYTYKGWEVDAELYHKLEKGTVEFLLPEFGIASGSLDQFAIGGDKKIYGLDLLLTKTIGKQHFIASYTLLSARSRYEGVNEGRYFRSLGVSTHEGSLVYKHQSNRWDFSASFVLSSGVPYTPVLGTFVVTLENGEQQQFVSLGNVNGRRTDWNHRLDLAAAYTVPLKNGALKFGISVFNVYDNLNVKFIDYFEIPEEDSDFYTLGRREVYGLGITPSLFLRLKI